MKIYHNPRCRKSRETLGLIQDAGIEPEIVEYLINPPSTEELDDVLTYLDMEPQQLMRTGELVYKELGLKDQTLSRQEAIKVMVENPKLIERPVVIKGKKAIIGRPPENVNELL